MKTDLKKVAATPHGPQMHSEELTVASKLRHRPPAPRNVGMPDSADMPAPDNTVTFCMTDSYP